MRSFKSSETIHKKGGGSYYVVSANKAPLCHMSIKLNNIITAILYHKSNRSKVYLSPLTEQIHNKTHAVSTANKRPRHRN